ncbi:MAG: PGF-pre-PGF domain-containing protein [archaeon]
MKRIFILVLLALAPLSYAYPYSPADTQIQNALQYLNSTQSSGGGMGSTSDTAYAVLAIQAAGGDSSKWNRTGRTPIDYLSNTSCGFNSSTSVSSYALTILAFDSAGKNASSICGKDLVQELASRQNPDGSFSAWVNDQAWAVLALSVSDLPDATVLAKAKDDLLTKQNPDGGFGFFGSSDADMTSLGIWAMLAGGVGVASPEAQNALSVLYTFRDPSGGFFSGSWGDLSPSSGSTAWSMSAIAITNSTYNWPNASFQDTTLSGQPNTTLSFRIRIEKASPFSFLSGLQHSDGSFLNRIGEPNWSPVQSTSYSIISLLGKGYPVSLPLRQDTALDLNISAQGDKQWGYSLSSLQALGISQADVLLNITIPPNATQEDASFNITLTHSSNKNAVYSAPLTARSVLPNLKASAAYPSSVQENSQIAISATVENSGGYGATNLNLSLYVNSALHQSAILNVSANSTASKSFYYTPPSAGSYSFLLSADPGNLIREINDTDNNLTFTVQATSPSPPASSGGGSFISALPTADQNSQTKTIAQISRGSTGSAEFTKDVHAVTQIRVKAASQINGLKLTVENKGTKNPVGTEPIGTVYKYLELTKNIEDAQIERAEIDFKVEASWIEENSIDPDFVSLSRHTAAGWEALPTEKTKDDGGYLYFRAETPGFSIFAITCRNLPPAPQTEPEPEPMGEPAPAPAAQPEHGAPTGLATAQESSSLRYLLIPAGILLLAGLAAKLKPPRQKSGTYKITRLRLG